MKYIIEKTSLLEKIILIDFVNKLEYLKCLYEVLLQPNSEIVKKIIFFSKKVHLFEMHKYNDNLWEEFLIFMSQNAILII